MKKTFNFWQIKYIFKNVFFIVFILFCVIAVTNIHGSGVNDSISSEDSDSISILFVGNSFVYTGDVPKQLQKLSNLYDIKMTYKDISTGGATLGSLKNNAVREMQRKNYDYVVFQDQSRRPLNNYNDFLNDVRFLSDVAKSNGAIPVLYNPAWANINEKPDESLQNILTEAYKKAAYENSAILVNAGDAWVYAYKKMPELSLYASDKFHANDTGAYFTACVFAATLFNLHIKDIAEDNLYTGDKAIVLGQTAWEFVCLLP